MKNKKISSLARIRYLAKEQKLMYRVLNTKPSVCVDKKDAKYKNVIGFIKKNAKVRTHALRNMIYRKFKTNISPHNLGKIRVELGILVNKPKRGDRWKKGLSVDKALGGINEHGTI